MAARTTGYANQDSEVSKTTTGYTDVGSAALTHTPADSTDVLYLWSVNAQVATNTSDVQVRFYHDTGTTAYAECNIESQEITNPVDYFGCQGVYVHTYGASPGSNTVSVEYASETNAFTVRAKYARIWSLELGANDEFVNGSATPQGTSDDTNYTDLTSGSLTFTPGSDGDYLVIASCECNGTVTVPAQVLLDVDGSNKAGYSHAPQDATNYIPWFYMEKMTLTAASHTIKVKFRSGTSGTTVNARRGRVVALRLSDFDASYYSESRSRAVTTSTSYVDHMTYNPTIAASVKHAIIGAWWFDNESTGSSGYSQFYDGTTTFFENINEANQGGTFEPRNEYAGATGYEQTLTAGSGVTWQIEVKTELVTCGIQEAAIAILQIDASAAAPGPTGNPAVTQYGALVRNPMGLLGIGRYVGA